MEGSSNSMPFRTNAEAGSTKKRDRGKTDSEEVLSTKDDQHQGPAHEDGRVFAIKEERRSQAATKKGCWVRHDELGSPKTY
jgi:hypothetical protein